MSDLISRQACIDALAPMAGVGNRVLDRIRSLPPAEPEIIRCKDCGWWTKQEDSLQGRCELMRMYPTGSWFCANAKRRQDG